MSVSLQKPNKEGRGIPAELLHRIFEILADEDEFTTLQACCLVARSWVSLCRCYLFENVELGPHYSRPYFMDSALRLVEVLNDNPSVIGCVRRLAFTEWPDDDLEDAGDFHCSLSDTASSTPVTRANSTLKSLTARVVTKFSLSRFKPCSELRTMELFALKVAPMDNQINTHSSLTFPNLTSLEVREVDNWSTYQNPTHETIFPALTSLILHDAAETFLQVSTLESLEVVFCYSGCDDEDERTAKLSQFIHNSRRNLTRLVLHIEAAETNEEPIARRISEILSPIQSCNVLRSLVLNVIDIFGDDVYVEDWLDEAYDTWEALGCTLGSPRGFPRLREVSISLEVACDDESLVTLYDILDDRGYPDFQTVFLDPFYRLIVRKDTKLEYREDSATGKNDSRRPPSSSQLCPRNYLQHNNVQRSDMVHVASQDIPCDSSYLSIFFHLPEVHTLEIRNSKEKHISYKAGDNPKGFGWQSFLDQYIAADKLTSRLLSTISNVPILAILSSPHLTTLNILNCHLSDTGSCIPSLYANRPNYALKHLTAQKISNLSLSLLGLCSNLQTVNLFVFTFAESGARDDIPSPFIFPSLTSLEIHFADGWDYFPTSADVTSKPGYDPQLSVISSLKISGIFEDLPLFCAAESLDLELNADDLGEEDCTRICQLVTVSQHHLTHIRINIVSEDDDAPISLQGIRDMLSVFEEGSVLTSSHISVSAVTDVGN
ncbi:hypothetical protein CVT24_005609 [Panaeolus cyanescens]|uniref:F-box domain-containing protein n=1 Tax=Panaeolus cyanescens TaxID=181874 RepID=A0A409YY70_9AGAR|nr:hypothetical protein CVT24_005609 [Panaeolus cyanescens]